uniref:Importin N-terminal domain-containing protein n=1 Tax=Compsopogon caeruleus TaxID=31354 RepID=A0A6T6CE73_9RHOD|mmetsp:Transcript_18034/g.37396  ORF Transcript_18034/g.37396 Transcript_18034/m.37396 type:complete len:1102 (+) Transcript_18034:377-3682(+)|eukprot:CAMPEP_0184678042 /NCGR_PEP_ID=MMETSP0312-20130426/665_1 /TAXON_ID=31354 /ORGANISM="Compsopogon coeruleus, Strain SAG 36.94" /LENGTH=1101 /DNA_ID=CAMNT_0027126361 /DNA_START=304 /DNA_END=3609 /DNA_ORIENTATION=+
MDSSGSLQGSGSLMNGLGSIENIDALAKDLYESTDPVTRQKAENVLLPLSTAAQYLPQCMWILDNAKSPFSRLLASSSICKIVTHEWRNLSLEERMQIRNYSLKHLAERGQGLGPYVVNELCTVVCRLTKMGWFENSEYKNLIEATRPFLTESEEHCGIGLQLLIRLVSEMNQPISSARRTLTQAQHRKVAISFRDHFLLGVQEIGLNTLVSLFPPPAHSTLRQYSLDLILACLSFDFIGTAVDESSEEHGTIHVPATWREVVEDPKTMNLFLDTYYACCNVDQNQSSRTLEIIVQLSSVRRSLFSSDEERLKFLRMQMSGMVQILRTRMGMDANENYHHFCRWLARLKGNYQLQELVNSDLYGEWIGLVSQFTLQSLTADWNWVGNSLHFLLCLWSRLVSSLPYLKGDALSYLDEHVQKIVETYVTSRLQTLHNRAPDDDDDEDETEFAEHLDSIPVIFRFQYETTCNFLCRLLDPPLQQYKTTLDQGLTSLTSGDVQKLERGIAWLVRVIAASVWGRLNASSSEAQELADGELSSRVFQLMIFIVEADASRQPSGNIALRNFRTRVRLDEAIVEFCQSFRKAYIGEQAVATSKVYTRMAECLRIPDYTVVLDVITRKIGYNLRTYGIHDGESVVSKSLTLLQDLSGGHSSSRLLGKLSTVKEMLRSHGEEHFPFMKGPDSRMGRHRTTFYQTLARILFTGLGGGEYDPESGFPIFMVPIEERLNALAAVPSNDAFVRDMTVKNAVIGILRDLRGVCSAASTRKTYSIFFEWIYEKHTSTILKLCEIYSSVGACEVTTPLLKFYAEFVHNRPMRIIFDSSSPDGILLFRETSKILVSYGTRVLAVIQQAESSGTKLDMYSSLYKGAGVSLSVFSRSLGGNYVNFGVFGLYGDPAFSDAVAICFRLALAIPLSELMAYPKVAKSYYGLIEILCTNHPADVVRLDHAVFSHLIMTLQHGIQSLEVWMSTQCAQALDHLSEYRFKLAAKNTEDNRFVGMHVKQSPEMFPRCLEILFQMILSDECQNQWSLSRLLLSLILTNEDAFLSIKKSFIASQANATDQAMAKEAFDKLMKEVQPNLESKNRDRFTQNVTIFRQAMKSVS